MADSKENQEQALKTSKCVADIKKNQLTDLGAESVQ